MNSKNSSVSASVILALAGAAIIWGATAPIMKLTLKTVPLYSLAFIRFGMASLILLPTIKNRLHVNKEDIPILILSAIFGVTFNISFFFWGVSLTTALNSGIIFAATPILTLFFAKLFLKEKTTNQLIWGSLLGILGISVIVGKNIATDGVSLSSYGDLLILVALFSFTAYEILGKKLLEKYNFLTITFYTFTIGAISFMPAAAYELISEPNWYMRLNASSYLGIGYGIIFSSFLAYSLWDWGLSKSKAQNAGLFFYLDPISAIAFSVLLLSEKVTPVFIIGTILIFCSLFIAEGHLPGRHHHTR